MKKIEVVQDILEANESIARGNKQLLDQHKVFAVNIMSAPGSGKTSLILKIMAQLKGKLKTAVIEGDIASTVDAEKVQEQADAVVQINTRHMPESCALIAAMVDQALKSLPLEELDLVLIENVGNLVCPSEFALGEHMRLVISSLPEGHDKPLKYPMIFADAHAVVVNKMDLLPYVDFDLGAFRRSVEGMNPGVTIFQTSCKTDEGIEEFSSWLLQQVKAGN